MPKKIKEAVKETVKDIKAEVKGAATEVVADVKEAATADVATFTIDRWHVALAAVAVTATLLVFIL